ncbi:hypothetical protein MMC07_005643, partial [Pseudocyphellaria aurata]|nr:hypothetical protein [Pseudocyphellaria aurata]
MRFDFLQSIDDIIKTPSRGVERPVRRITSNGVLREIAEEGPEIPERGSSKGKLRPMKIFQAGPSTAVEPPLLEQVEGCRMFYEGGALARPIQSFNRGAFVYHGTQPRRRGGGAFDRSGFNHAGYQHAPAPYQTGSHSSQRYQLDEPSHARTSDVGHSHAATSGQEDHGRPHTGEGSHD